MAVRIVNWRPEEIEKATIALLTSHADDTGKFIETTARKSLDSITSPDNERDRNYRSYLSKWLLTYTVEANARSLVIRVGMKIGKRGQTHHGYYIELGSQKAPAHPYLRPALFNHKREILELLTS